MIDRTRRTRRIQKYATSNWLESTPTVQMLQGTNYSHSSTYGEFGDALIMLAPSRSTIPNTSDQNYQTMLTTEPADTANIVDVPANLSTPFDSLTNSDADAGER